MESLVKQSELVNQVVVVGSGRKFPAALIVPDWESLASIMPAGWGERSRIDRSRDPEALKKVQSEITGLTAELNDYERIRRVALLPDEFTIDGGELTPTLKVKRRVIDEKFGGIIDELYGPA
jgi:long-chain acyl-CoA synthetase